MSFSLTIFPRLNDDFLVDQQLGKVYAFEHLRFHQCYEIFEQLREIRDNTPSITTTPLPKKLKVWYYTDGGIRKTRTDSYGDELEYVLSDDLVSGLKWPEKLDPRNKAIRAYLKALPKDTIIILWWS